MEKIRLPKEVAGAIDRFHQDGDTDQDLMCAVLGNANNTAATTIRSYIRNHGGFNNLMQALVNGYEVERTPEDKVREYYERLTSEGHEWERTHSYANIGNPYFAEMQGVAKTLGILGITIPGVNGGDTE